jgi:hypothetical protein
LQDETQVLREKSRTRLAGSRSKTTSKDVPSFKAAAKQQGINNDVSLYNEKIKDWSRIRNPSLF